MFGDEDDELRPGEEDADGGNVALTGAVAVHEADRPPQQHTQQN